MIRIFDFVKVRHAHAMYRPGAVNLVPRLRRIFIALALALTVGRAGQPLPVQAAPAGATEIRFSMSARKLYGNAPICVGDNVLIHVRVMRAEVVGDPANLGYAQDLPGVMVEATTSDTGVGTLNQNTISTGWDSNDPGGADFKFHADKAGSTTVSFKGTINHIWWPAKLGLPPLVDRKDFVNAQVDIKVEDCQYKVTAISHWGGVALQHNYEAFTVEAALTADAPGHYTGTATVYWIISNPPPERCPHSVTTTTQVDLTGVMDADGQQLVVDMTYQPGVENWIVLRSDDCTTPAGMVDAPIIPEPLTFSVPASGGGLTQSHVLTSYESGVLSGSADVTVIRVTSH